jgi:hypothetical protein
MLIGLAQARSVLGMRTSYASLRDVGRAVNVGGSQKGKLWDSFAIYLSRAERPF